MLNFLIWIVVGGVIGLAGSFVLRTYVNPGLRANVVIGMAGAVFAAFLVAPLLGLSDFNPIVFSFPAMLVAMVGALTLVPLAYLMRSGFPSGARHE